jgi:hypothetical protein
VNEPALVPASTEVALTVGTLRHVTVTLADGTHRAHLLAGDVCALLGLTGLVATVTAAVSLDAQTYLRVHEGAAVVTRLTLTLDGVRELARLHPVDPAVAARVLAHVTRLSHRVAARDRRAPTRWGRQPIRRVVRDRGFSARAFVEAANALPLPGVAPLTVASYAAWSYGGCLPEANLVTRACALLDASPADLFDAAVLAAIPHRGRGRRQPRPVSASGPRPARP